MTIANIEYECTNIDNIYLLNNNAKTLNNNATTLNNATLDMPYHIGSVMFYLLDMAHERRQACPSVVVKEKQ